MGIRFRGELERILNEFEPTRHEMLFALGTIKKGMGLDDENISSIIHGSSWNNYTRKKAIEFLKSNPSSFFLSSSNYTNEEKKIWWTKKGYVRTTMFNEVALDLDSKESFNAAVKIFDSWNLKGNCRTWIGAKGGHISLFFDQPIDKSFKEKVRIFFGGDPGQVNISVENKLHHKTGSTVNLIRENKGVNPIKELTRRIEK